MVLAREEADIARVKMLALHGMSKDAWNRFGDSGYKHYQVVECGFKYNMMDIQAAIGIHQLARVEQNWLRRHEIWQEYQTAFSDLRIQRPAEPAPDTRHAHHLYTILIDETRCGISRDAFLDRMAEAGIGVGVHYLSLPEHPFYQQRFSWRPDEFPHAMKIGRQTLSLPLSAKLADDHIERIIANIQNILKQGKP